MTVDSLLDEIRRLSVDERKQLISLIVDTLTGSPEALVPKKHSILELVGLGAETWEGIDPQEYINQLRSEWDERP